MDPYENNYQNTEFIAGAENPLADPNQQPNNVGPAPIIDHAMLQN